MWVARAASRVSGAAGRETVVGAAEPAARKETTKAIPVFLGWCTLPALVRRELLGVGLAEGVARCWR
jgi:hypothetical protein